MLLSRKTQVMAYVTIIVVALSISAVLYMLMPDCGICGNKLCFGNCTPADEVSNNGNGHPLRTDIPQTNQTSIRLQETSRIDPTEYFNNVVLVGDSRTVGFTQYKSGEVPSNRIYAKNSSNHEEAMYAECVQLTEGKFVSIPEAVRITAPKIIIVNFGINSAYLGTDGAIDQFAEGYQAFIDALLENSPHSIIVLEAVMPVSTSYEQKTPTINNENIDRINMRLLEMAQENGYYYLATNEGMKNEYNALDPAYTSDGLHFNQAGYDYILEYILSHAIILQ